MTLRRGSWVFFFALLFGGALMTFQLGQRVKYDKAGHIGDGKELASYGFDLSTCLISIADIYPAGVPRDGLPSLDLPRHLNAAELDSLNQRGRSPFILPRDRVIGIMIGGEARAYPLSILDWHEVVNDIVGGEPVLVTWSPLTGSARVYERISDAGFAMEFGVSGLLHDSNTLLYDRARPEGDGENLWSQIQGRAISGPAAARDETLRIVPALLIRWDKWLERHPTSLILAPLSTKMRNYKKKPYNSYVGSDRLQFPVRNLPDRERMPLKTSVLSIEVADTQCLYPFPLIAANAGTDGLWHIEQGGRRLAIIYGSDPPTANARAMDGRKHPTWSQAYWFAWYSQNPGRADSLLFTSTH